MVDYNSLVQKILPKSSDKQNSYLSNIFGVGGGAVMYTAWQTILNETLSLNLYAKVLFMLILSLVLLFLGYSFVGRSNETDNS